MASPFESSALRKSIMLSRRLFSRLFFLYVRISSSIYSYLFLGVCEILSIFVRTNFLHHEKKP